MGVVTYHPVEKAGVNMPPAKKAPSKKASAATAKKAPSAKTLAALEAGRKTRDAKNAERKATGATAKGRLAKLQSGELTVKDLDLTELKRGRLHDGNGSFTGKPPKMPVRLVDQMHGEYLRRINNILHKGAPKAAKRLVDMLDDAEVSDTVQLAAAKLILERTVGKVPDVVHVGTETEWDRLQQGAVVFDRAELDDDQGQTGD